MSAAPGVVFFGGEHGDVPLEPTAGTLIADTIVDYQMSAVLDLSLMSKTKARSFAAAFAERLYQRNRDPLHLVVDEADVLIPQRADATTARLVGAMEDIAKRGRGRGLGLTVASQRGQEVHKSVLDIMGNVILLGMTGRLNIKAVSDWITVNAASDETSASEVIGSLPSLGVGEAWFWSPMFMRTVQKVRVNMFTTFDSKATPKVGQRRIVPTRRVKIDLAKLGEEIAATVERAKENDLRSLKARLAELQRRDAAYVAEIERLRAERETADPEFLRREVAEQAEALRVVVAEREDRDRRISELEATLATVRLAEADRRYLDDIAGQMKNFADTFGDTADRLARIVTSLDSTPPVRAATARQPLPTATSPATRPSATATTDRQPTAVAVHLRHRRRDRHYRRGNHRPRRVHPAAHRSGAARSLASPTAQSGEAHPRRAGRGVAAADVEG